MSDVLKRVLCLALALVVVFSFAGCRKSPVLEQKVYTQDAETDPEQQQNDNQEDNTQEDSTLPPRTTKQEASQQADQTKVSANRPQPNPQTRPNTNNQGQNTQVSTQSPNNNQSNTNKGSGEVPGVSEDPNSPIPAVDRNAVNRADLPEDVATVAAVGDAALYVEMLGGANRLLASSASFTTNYYAQKFSDFNNVKGLWEKNGETAMTEAQFQQLLAAYPEAVFYIADVNSNSFQTFTEEQLTILNQKGVYTIPLSLFNTTDNIKNNVRTIGKVLGKGSKVPNAPNANDRASDYIKWMDDIIGGKESQTFSGSNKWNLDKDGAFRTQAQVVDRYADVGQYTILIEGWDDSVSTSVEQGVAYTHTGYTHRVSPVSYYLSIGGAANTAVQIADNIVRDIPVTPLYRTTVYGDVNGGAKGNNYKEKMYDLTCFDGHYIGDGSFNKIIVDSQATKGAMEQSESWRFYEYQPYGSNTENPQYGYGRPNGETMDFSNVHGEYSIVVNPYGIGSWTTGSPESPLEVLWAEQLFLNGQNPDGAFNYIANEVRYFYETFYGIKISNDDLNAIKNGV